MMMIRLIRIKKNKKRITKKKLITIIKLIRINKYMTKKILTNRKKKSKLKMQIKYKGIMMKKIQNNDPQKKRF